jgi:hypothetical protein
MLHIKEGAKLQRVPSRLVFVLRVGRFQNEVLHIRFQFRRTFETMIVGRNFENVGPLCKALSIVLKGAGIECEFLFKIGIQ